MVRRKAPSLLDLCVYTAIDNVRYLGDVGETDLDLLGRILPHCTVDQLEHIEKSTEVRMAMLFFETIVFRFGFCRSIKACFFFFFFDKSYREEIWVQLLISCGRNSTRKSLVLRILNLLLREWGKKRWRLNGWNCTRCVSFSGISFEH